MGAKLGDRVCAKLANRGVRACESCAAHSLTGRLEAIEGAWVQN